MSLKKDRRTYQKLQLKSPQTRRPITLTTARMPLRAINRSRRMTATAKTSRVISGRAPNQSGMRSKLRTIGLKLYSSAADQFHNGCNPQLKNVREYSGINAPQNE